jgi:hypothetical protein
MGVGTTLENEPNVLESPVMETPQQFENTYKNKGIESIEKCHKKKKKG